MKAKEALEQLMLAHVCFVLNILLVLDSGKHKNSSVSSFLFRYKYTFGFRFRETQEQLKSVHICFVLNILLVLDFGESLL